MQSTRLMGESNACGSNLRRSVSSRANIPQAARQSKRIGNKREIAHAGIPASRAAMIGPQARYSEGYRTRSPRLIVDHIVIDWLHMPRRSDLEAGSAGSMYS